MDNNIYQIGIQSDPYTDYATRIIIAPNKEKALKMWRRITDKHHFKYFDDTDHIHIKDLGPGPVSKVFNVTTG